MAQAQAQAPPPAGAAAPAEESSGAWSAVKEKCSVLPWQAIYRFLGIVCGAALIVIGVLNFIEFIGVQETVNAFYQIIFGVLMILAEVHFKRALAFFSFLTSYPGLGAFYIFVGGLALGSEWYEVLLAVVMVLIGGTYVAMGCCGNWRMYAPEDGKEKEPQGKQMETMQTPQITDEEMGTTGAGSHSQSISQPSSSNPVSKPPPVPPKPQAAPAKPAKPANNEETAWPEEDY